MPPKKKARPNPQKKRKYQSDDEDESSVEVEKLEEDEKEDSVFEEVENDEDGEDSVDEESDFDDDDDEDSVKPKRKKSVKKGTKTSSAKSPKAQKPRKSRYVKKGRTLSGTNMSKLKYMNTRKTWIAEPSYQETEEYYRDNPIALDQTEILHTRAEDLLSVLAPITLESWLQEREIILESFQTVKIHDKFTNQSVEVSPFEGKCPNVEAVQLDTLECYFNLSSPIRHTKIAPHPSLLHFANSQTVLTFHIAVGLTRVGWPARNEDYERRCKEKLVPTLLSNPFEPSGSEDLSLTDKSEKIYGVGNDYWRGIEEIDEHDNLIPIYSISHKIFKTTTTKPSSSLTSSTSHNISYFISLNHRGSAISMEWNPNLQPNNLMLGLLAVVGGDGNCIILLPPNESRVPKTNATSNSTFLSKPVITERDVTVAMIRKTNTVHVTSVSWHPSNLYQVCCGMSDGSVIIYDIRSCFDQNSAPKIIMKFRNPCVDSTNPALSALTAAKICPYQPSIILSAGYDGDIRVWQKGKVHPISVTPCPDAIVDANWDPHGCGFYYSEIDVAAVNWEALWSFSNIPRSRACLYQHNYRAGAVWKTIPFSYHNHTALCSAASDGTIRGGFAACLGLNKEPFLSFFEYFRIVSVVHPKSNVAPESSATVIGSETAAGCTSSNTIEDGSKSNDSSRLPTITVDSKFNLEPPPLITNDIRVDHTVAVHSIDHMIVEDEKFSVRYHFLVFGGAAGMMAIRFFAYPAIPDNDDDD